VATELKTHLESAKCLVARDARVAFDTVSVRFTPLRVLRAPTSVAASRSIATM
jgi:hypothetical protein